MSFHSDGNSDSSSIDLTELRTKFTDGMEDSLATELFAMLADVCPQLMLRSRSNACSDRLCYWVVRALVTNMFAEFDVRQGQDTFPLLSSLLAVFVNETG